MFIYFIYLLNVLFLVEKYLAFVIILLYVQCIKLLLNIKKKKKITQCIKISALINFRFEWKVFSKIINVMFSRNYFFIYTVHLKSLSSTTFFKLTLNIQFILNSSSYVLIIEVLKIYLAKLCFKLYFKPPILKKNKNLITSYFLQKHNKNLILD